jgi:hypothetical protein
VVLLFSPRKSAVELSAIQLPAPFVHDSKIKTQDCGHTFDESQIIFSELIGLHLRMFEFYPTAIVI